MNIFPDIQHYLQRMDLTLPGDPEGMNQPFFSALADELNWPKAVTATFGDRQAVLEQLGVQAGDYVLLPNLNALPWAEAAQTLGADCILIDHHPDHWQMDLDLLEEFLMNFTMLNEQDELVLKKDSRTVRAVITPHLLGGMCDMERVTFICLRFHLALGEDISQALGSSWKNKPAGSFGLVNYCEFKTNPVLPFGQAVIFSNGKQKLSEKHSEKYPVDQLNNHLGKQLVPQVPEIITLLQQTDSGYRNILSELQLNWLKSLPEVQTNGLSAAFTSQHESHEGAVPMYDFFPSTLHHAVPFQKSLYIRREDWSTQIYQSGWLLPLHFGDRAQMEAIRQALAKGYEA